MFRPFAAFLLGLLLATPGTAYEDYALSEGLRCSACHQDEETFLLTKRGREYKANGYSFEVPKATTMDPKAPKRPKGPPPAEIRSRPVPEADTQVMRRAEQVLQDAARAVALGHYERAAVAAGELQDLAGKMEGHRRALRTAAADLAAVTRDAAFQLERTLRTGGDRRPQMAPLMLGRVTGACLRCHVSAGLSTEDWSRDATRPEVAHGAPRQRHRPHSRSGRPEGPLPSGRRNWDGESR